MLLATLAALAIVTQDQAALRAGPQRAATQHAVLWQGDTLEVRGEQLDYLQVYDHRRERAGYVAAAQVRRIDTAPAAAPALLAVVEFLREARGEESLGIAYAAAFLKAAPAEAITAEPWLALGLMADRLAARASAPAGTGGAKLAAHLEVAAGFGVRFISFEREGRIQICYDGDALRRVLAMAATAAQHAQAALALTRHECVDPALPPLQRQALDEWRADVLARADSGALPPLLQNRIRIRRAGVQAGLAFALTRRGESGQEVAASALEELAAVAPAQLTEEDRAAYTDAAVRVGASRWAAEGEGAGAPAGALRIATAPGVPGETCVSLLEGPADKPALLLRRCTYGTVWPASAVASRARTALTLAVQPLATWRELWVFRKDKDGWSLRVLPPSAEGPDVGYAEFAGWVPNKPQLLVAREARVQGRWQRSFEVVSLASLATLRRADEPEHLSAFYRWQTPAWKALTVSLR